MSYIVKELTDEGRLIDPKYRARYSYHDEDIFDSYDGYSTEEEALTAICFWIDDGDPLFNREARYRRARNFVILRMYR